MLFNSYLFILLFLPLTLLLYYGLNHFNHSKMAKGSLILMSLIFYGYFHIAYLLILTGSVLFNFFLSRIFTYDLKHKKIFLFVGIFANIGLIFYFKYFNFFIENINVITGREVFALKNILMPLGISFFTFQQISFLVDSYRGETADYHFLDYALFITFFPQLIAGPIVMHQEMIPQFRNPEKRRFSHNMFARGLFLFSAGLFKKVMIADTLANGVNWGYNNIASATVLDALVTTFLYSFQIYFDFSGYCDMANGIASMFHFELPINFDSPYKSKSIREFWQKWHMTLTRFLTKYLYIPLGGSKNGTFRTMLNVMIVFLISGIWHGAAWTFVLWGILHGIANVFSRMMRRTFEKIPGGIRTAGTFVMVSIFWIFFRADTLEQVVLFGKILLQNRSFALSYGLLEQFHLIEFTYLEDHVGFWGRLAQSIPAIHLILCGGISALIVFVPHNINRKVFKPTFFSALLTIVLFVWSILSLSNLSAFLYFNF